MNDELMNLIDSIELNGIFQEMEVCTSLARLYEKQATILECAIVPESFEFFMESSSSDSKSSEKKKDDKKEKDEKLGITKTESADSSKSAWIRKIWEYIKKFMLIGVRLIERLIAKMKTAKVDKIFEKPGAKARVPETVLSVAKAYTKLIIFDHAMAIYLASSVGDTKLYDWCVKIMNTMTDTDLTKNRALTVGPFLVEAARTIPHKKVVTGKVAEYLKILEDDMKKVNNSNTHIPELFEIIESFAGKLKKYNNDIKIMEYKDVQKNKLSADRMHNVNALLSKLEKVTHTHTKQALFLLKHVSKLVKDEKEVTVDAVIKELNDSKKDETPEASVTTESTTISKSAFELLTETKSTI